MEHRSLEFTKTASKITSLLRPKHFNCAKSFPDLYFCYKCKFKTDLLVFLHNHIKHIHSEQQPHANATIIKRSCKKCCYTTYSAIHFRKHRILGCPRKCKKWLLCDHCPFKTQIRFSLNAHTKRHLPKSKNPLPKTNESYDLFECSDCSFKSVYKEAIKQHTVNKHTAPEDVIWYHCEHCSFKSKSKYYLATHVNMNHADPEKQKWYLCPHCEFKCLVKYYLKAHILNKHDNSETAFKFKCEKCDYKTKRRTHLDSHKLAHHMDDKDIKWFKCESCTFQTKRKELLGRHVTVKHVPDEKIQWFYCSYCDYKAKVKKNLRMHLDMKHVDMAV